MNNVDILVKYKNHDPLMICLNDGSYKSKYLDLVKKNSDNCPISRDPKKYSIEYFRKLAQQANTVLGWDWVFDDYPISLTTLLHKNIEEYLSQGFQNIPEEYDTLLHELHYALHVIQGTEVRGNWIQVEWFNDDFITMPDDLVFTTNLKFGDVKLQNPYVGHDPLFVVSQSDFSNISQTCKFHDIIRPGINMVTKELNIPVPNNYLDIFKSKDPNWFNTVGPDKILRHTGWPVVGKVLNTNILQDILLSDFFEIENVTVL